MVSVFSSIRRRLTSFGNVALSNVGAGNYNLARVRTGGHARDGTVSLIANAHDFSSSGSSNGSNGSNKYINTSIAAVAVYPWCKLEYGLLVCV